VSDDVPFADLMLRLRSGDQEAAVELLRQFEPEIRREVRVRLRDPRLRRVFDSMDICQSVLGSFFLRVALGQYELSRPDDVIRLLIAMTRNKVAGQARRQQAQRRDNRRDEPGGPEKLESLADGPSPSRIVAGAELLAEVRNRLSREERVLAEWRSEGRDWRAIATELGGTANARRKQLARAIDRIARELGLDEVSDG
jgi:DNA-directed RNA polymerase specialized sigma24 family protein